MCRGTKFIFFFFYRVCLCYHGWALGTMTLQTLCGMSAYLESSLTYFICLCHFRLEKEGRARRRKEDKGRKRVNRNSCALFGKPVGIKLGRVSGSQWVESRADRILPDQTGASVYSHQHNSHQRNVLCNSNFSS